MNIPDNFTVNPWFKHPEEDRDIPSTAVFLCAYDLNVGIDTIEKLAGVRAAPGGQHPGQGTRNALIALGADTYLEILGPDREQPAPDRPRRFGLDDLIAPRLVAWAAKGDDLTRVSRAAVANGIRLG